MLIFPATADILISLYSKTSMARTYLGPWKFIQGMGRMRLIMAPCQEANGDNIGNSF